MFEEAQSAPGNYRSTLLSQTRGHENELKLLKRELVSKHCTDQMILISIGQHVTIDPFLI